MISADRPLLERWRSTPWVARTPVDDRTVGAVLDEEVQVAFRGTGRMSERELVPLSAGAHELLYGPHRVAARDAIRGMLATLDGVEGAANLRGMSMSSDPASFATNLLLSNTEAGFFPDSVATGDEAGFERSMVRLAPSVTTAKAQNTGWIDLGPRVSAKLRDVIERGPAADRDGATEVALTLLHELQHSVTPPDPNEIDDRHVWLEEGIAETLAWWPGQAAALRGRLGVPVDEGRETIDPWSVPEDSVASIEYRGNHRAVQQLLALAGVEPIAADGRIDRGAHARARQLLQGDVVERVPRALARAIVDQHDLPAEQVDAIAALIPDVRGDASAVSTLAATLGIRS